MSSVKRFAALAHRIADRAVIADIETEANAQTDEHGQRWYDTRPLLDPRELPDDWVEMNRQALEYAIGRGLVEVHHLHDHLVRVQPRDAAAKLETRREAMIAALERGLSEGLAP